MSEAPSLRSQIETHLVKTGILNALCDWMRQRLEYFFWDHVDKLEKDPDDADCAFHQSLQNVPCIDDRIRLDKAWRVAWDLRRKTNGVLQPQPASVPGATVPHTSH